MGFKVLRRHGRDKRQWRILIAKQGDQAVEDIRTI